MVDDGSHCSVVVGVIALVVDFSEVLETSTSELALCPPPLAKHLLPTTPLIARPNDYFVMFDIYCIQNSKPRPTENTKHFCTRGTAPSAT